MMDPTIIDTIKTLAGFGVGGIGIHYIFKFAIWVFNKFFATIEEMSAANKENAERFAIALQSIQTRSKLDNEAYIDGMRKIGEGMDALRRDGQCKYKNGHLAP